MAQTALNSPLFNGQSGQGQALLVLPQAPTEALPPGVDAQSAQRVRLAAQGAINSLTISKSPNQQSVLAQVGRISVDWSTFSVQYPGRIRLLADVLMPNSSLCTAPTAFAD